MNLDKHVDEGATRCCILEQCPQLLCTFYGDLDLEIPTFSANVTESAARIEVTRPWFLLQAYTVNSGDVSIADYLVAEV